jgi:hypothetical protein
MRFSVDKFVLFSKLSLFSSNPSLLHLSDYTIRSSVLSSAVSNFIEMLSNTKFVMTEANYASLTLLSEEFGLSALSDACKKVSVLHGREPGHDFNFLKLEAVSLRETNVAQEKQIWILTQEVSSLRSICSSLQSELSSLRSLSERLEQSVRTVTGALGSEQNHHRFCEHFYGVHGFPKMEVLGQRFLRQSADSGHSDAQYRYGTCLRDGIFCERDDFLTFKYTRMSADNGNPFGQNLCGLYLDEGRAIAKDHAKAAQFYKLSADQGYARGQNNYGLCLENGRGVAQNVIEAVKYYKMSADQGHAIMELASTLAKVLHRM